MVLEGEGLVRRYPNRGCFVNEITTQDLVEIFSLRKLLEPAALQSAYDKINPAQLHQLHQDLFALTPSDKPELYYETDRQLHSMIISNCGNLRLMQILRTLNGQIELLRRISAKQPRRLEASRKEHLAVVEAIEQQNLDGACKALEEHLANIQASTMKVCMQMGVANDWAFH